MKIGVIGGGQLAQMLALAGYPLGIKIVALESTPDCPAGLVTEVLVGDYADQTKLQQLAEQVDVITYEFENIPITALEKLIATHHIPIYPPLAALANSQDRLDEKNFFDKLKIPTTKYSAIHSLQDLNLAVERFGLPAILKTRRLGYDGKGQYLLRTKPDIEIAWEQLKNQPLILESFVEFEREVSCIAVRDVNGEIAFYPLIENTHRGGILRVSEVASSSARIERLAREYVTRILTELNYVGILTVEFFQKDGELIANEMAPRVHNSGHWTIEGAQISQFENHLRAVAGLPLGSTDACGKVAMINFISQIPDITRLLKIPEVHCHLYSKEPREGRKLGHATLCVNDKKTYAEKLQQLKSFIT